MVQGQKRNIYFLTERKEKKYENFFTIQMGLHHFTLDENLLSTF